MKPQEAHTTTPWENNQMISVADHRLVYVAQKGEIMYVCLPGAGRVPIGEFNKVTAMYQRPAHVRDTSAHEQFRYEAHGSNLRLVGNGLNPRKAEG